MPVMHLSSQVFSVKVKKESNICHIDPTPGSSKDAQMPFINLLKARVQDLISRDKETNWKERRIQV